ncbi:uncharacterized protein LOC122306174 [Carya illinoinensis]|uniref:uncharacterized protein LOC122306174 n=1 Tax=Carya illinoinensis TaxID=32201 RepID=UPI001C71E2F7|nr:uncharacterized protein LOC122306174 [Carya illinoinensis]
MTGVQLRRMPLLLREVRGNERLEPLVVQEERSNHVLWSCATAQDIWADNESFLQKAKWGETDFCSTCKEMQETLTVPQLELCACVLRQLWLRRNRWVFYDAFAAPRTLWLSAKSELEEFQQAQHSVTAQHEEQHVVRNIVKWRRPEGDWLKANWDAAFSESSRKMGGGCVVRNCDGEILVAAAWPRSFISNPLQAEALALERATDLCAELGFQKVIFKGDSLILVKDILCKEENMSWYGQLVEDLKPVFTNESSRRLQHGLGNQAAHVLAKLALQCNEEVVCLEEGPREIMNCIDHDKFVSLLI